MCCNVSRHFALLLSQLSWQRRNGDQFSWENPGTEDKKITAVTASSGFSQNQNGGRNAVVARLVVQTFFKYILG